jgi:hypothetical protein
MTLAPAGGTRVRVLPERWIGRVSAFIRSAGTLEESLAEDRPEVVFTRGNLATGRASYSDYNIRTRHFRCLETFFVETDAQDVLRAVVALDGFRTSQRILNVSLVVARPDGSERSERLSLLLTRVLGEAAGYAAAEKLRFTYVVDSRSGVPLGSHLSELLLQPPEQLPFHEDARIPNETGQDREAVLLAFAPAGEA